MDHNGLYTDLDSFSFTNCGTTNNAFNDTCPPLPSLNNFKYQQPNLSSNIYQHDQQQQNHSAKSSQPQTQININNCNNNIFFPHDDGIFDANTTQCATANQKNNFIGYIRKEAGASGGGDNGNITYINNINTNIVNNINNPTNLVGGSDIFGGNQFHQINKNGETIINFTNNNLNASGNSIPTDTVTATSQNFYGYQNNNAQGQQTVFETSVQSQSSTYSDPNLKGSMGTTGYHGHQNQNGYLSGNGTEHYAPVDPFSDPADPLSTAKIINNFEAKNPIKYPNKQERVGSYYKGTADYPQYSHLPPHNYPPGLYQSNHNKIPNYEPYPRISPRNNVPHYPTQPYPNTHSMDVGYNRAPVVPHPPYHLPHPPHPPNNYYNNGYPTISPYPPTYQQMPYGSPLLRNESCSKASSGYKPSAPADHNNFHNGSYSAKKDFYNEFYPPQHYFEENAMNSCAKKSTRPKNPELYNPNGAVIYPEMTPHHPQNANVMRNMSYQPMPKHCGTYPMPPNPIEPYHNYFPYPYKNGEHAKPQKVNPAMSSKQFKNYSHFDQIQHQTHLPYGHGHSHPQYHTMQAKPPEKIKISIDLEEQINCSKIPKMNGYNYDPHHHYYQYHHHMPRNAVNDIDPSKNPIANINISLRDFLSTWNEIDDDEEARQQQPEDVERTIMREFNPMFVQKVTDNFNETPAKPNEMESRIISEGTEKLYVLESIDVPLSELNKYKHLNVINKLPENVVINDKELYADVDGSMKFIEEIDLAREKLYKSEFELEFEACQERKVHKIENVEKNQEGLKALESSGETHGSSEKNCEVLEKALESSVKAQVGEKKLESSESDPKTNDIEKSEKQENSKEKIPSRRKSVAQAPKLPKRSKSPRKNLDKLPKIKQTILKLKKEKILKASKVRITKRLKKYSLNQGNFSSSVKSLQSICVDFINTSSYRNFAREQSKIMEKVSKMRILKDIKKKFNFDGMKRNPLINQKFNHSVRINSLREICGNILKDKSKLLEIDECQREEQYSLEDFPTLKELSKAKLTEMDIDVVEDEVLYTPGSLKELCESFIYSNSQFFHIEEVPSDVPKLQDLCKAVLSETNIFINIDNEEMFEAADEPMYIVEENSGKVGELFESENLNSFERSEILRKIHIEDDEIFQAIGALHECDESISNNNDRNVSNKNFRGDLSEFSGEKSPYISFMDEVQYEEIVGVKGDGGARKKLVEARKIVEILRHKHLNRHDERQTSLIVGKVVKKALKYQRSHRFVNAKRRQQIDSLKRKAEASAQLKESTDCDKIPENESQPDAKESDDSAPDDCFESEAESNFPKLPVVFPSINEYKIQKATDRCDLKDVSVVKKRKLTFDESLLQLDKIYGENGENGRRSSHSIRRQRDPRRHSSSHHRSHHDSKRRESYHSSSRRNSNPKDQIKHSEAKRLVIPSYKIYDKDLDIKLKTMPFVKIEREEKVDGMVKKYN